MASKKSVSDSVDAYLTTLEHPHKAGVEALRSAILGVDRRIEEEIKWNAPSFRLDDHFATFRLHPGATFQLVLHTGAKTKAAPKSIQVDDPQGLLKWASKERCVLTFSSAADARSKQPTVIAIVKQWIAQL